MKLDNSKKLKVGIPRGLFYYRDFPFWKTFFESLGAFVVVSPNTNIKILEYGASCLTSDICLPVRAFCGHAIFLAKNCDFLFIPSIYSLEKNVYNCPKLIGLPDLIKSVTHDSFKILDLDINLEQGKENFYQNLYQIARNFTTDKQRIKLSIESAKEAQNDFDESLKKESIFLPIALDKLSSSSKKTVKANCYVGGEKNSETEPNYYATVGLVGHPYLTYDEYLNHQLVSKLKKMGIKVVFPEQISRQKLRKSLLKLTDRPYWTFEEDIVGAGVYFLERKEVDGLICVSAFGCGPDSLMMELLKRYAKDSEKILLHLNLDEHTAEAGLITRLEAFVDSLKQSRQSHAPRLIFHQSKKERIQILGIPNMGEKPFVLKKIFKEKFGITLVSPKVTQKTITLGVKHSPEDACLPFKATLGSFIECLEQGADSLVMVASVNACRMGYYLRVQEKILQDLGYQFDFLKFHNKDRSIRGVLSFIKRLTDSSWPEIFSFCLLVIAKINTIDAIEREVQKIRPLEIKKGHADEIYYASFKAIDEAESISSLRKTRKEYLKKLLAVPIDEKFKPLKVGIVGELYVVAEPFVNMDLEKELGRRGVLVERPKSSFFSEYAKPFHFNPLGKEKKRLEQFTKPYLKRDVGGHGLESLGLKIEYARKKYDGIVHLMPFTCMPEIIAQNIMVSTKEKIPVLTVICDEELGRAGLITRIEAFVDLLREKSTV